MGKQYNRVMLGRGGQFAEECRKGGYIGAGFEINEDLAPNMPKDWREFRERYVPLYMQLNPEKSKVVAGLACGALWTICGGLQNGDLVLCPRGNGVYMVGEIAGDYFYAEGETLMHRRPVKWYDKVIRRSDMSKNLRNSSGSIGTCCDITRYAEEIEDLLANAGNAPVQNATKQVAPTQKRYLERDLHPLFCTYLRDKDIFAKTIYHEKSTSSDKAQKWVHPDIIGVEEFGNMSDASKTLLRTIDAGRSVCLYSYEMKKEINTDYDLKEYFFQALSNSSWANYGYLVAFEISEDVMEEMERLNRSFGIGVIKLSPYKDDTTILFPARKNELDYYTIDKLCRINTDFKNFITRSTKVINAQTEVLEDVKGGLLRFCDKGFATDDEMLTYCKENHIPY